MKKLSSALLIAYSPFVFANTNVPVQELDAARIKPLKENSLLPTIKPDFKKEELKAPELVPIDKSSTFILKKIILKGNTKFTTEELSFLYKKYINKKVDINILKRIAFDITVKYRNKGYILSKAVLNAQEVIDGIITIDIVEGFVDEVLIDTATHIKLKKQTSSRLYAIIDRLIHKIKDERPANIKTVEQSITLINTFPGIHARIIFLPSKKTYGASKLVVLITEKKQLESYAIVDNRVSRTHGDFKTTAGIIVNSPEDLFAIDFNGTTSNESRQMKSFGIGSNYIINEKGLSLNCSADFNNTRPDIKNVVGFSSAGQSKNFTIGLSYPIYQTKKKIVRLSSNLNFVSSRNDSDVSSSFKDNIRSLRFSINYQNRDSYYGVNSLHFIYSKGLKLFGASKNASSSTVSVSRPGSKIDYSKINVHLARVQYLPNRFTLLARANGQYSFHKLLSSEEYGYGGEFMGRGFDGSTLVGDRGIGSLMELNYSIKNKKTFKSIRPYISFDAARVWNLNNQKLVVNGNSKRKASATSLALGIRWDLNNHLKGKFEIAKPLSYRSSRGKGARFFFNVSAVI